MITIKSFFALFGPRNTWCTNPLVFIRRRNDNFDRKYIFSFSATWSSSADGSLGRPVFLQFSTVIKQHVTNRRYSKDQTQGKPLIPTTNSTINTIPGTIQYNKKHNAYESVTPTPRCDTARICFPSKLQQQYSWEHHGVQFWELAGTSSEIGPHTNQNHTLNHSIANTANTGRFKKACFSCIRKKMSAFALFCFVLFEQPYMR